VLPWAMIFMALTVSRVYEQGMAYGGGIIPELVLRCLLVDIFCRMWKRWSGRDKPLSLLFERETQRLVVLVQKSPQHSQVSEYVLLRPSILALISFP
jgi:hypothetical protein